MPDAPTWTVKINAPVEKVWPLVADVGRHGEWSPKSYQMEWTNRYDVSSDGTTTSVVKTMSGPPTKGFGRVAFAIAFPLIVRPGVQKGMDMLKAKAET
jgi:hypothetical protein